jgi:hypothetical protein
MMESLGQVECPIKICSPVPRGGAGRSGEGAEGVQTVFLILYSGDQNGF